jgi:hypothetical protein
MTQTIAAALNAAPARRFAAALLLAWAALPVQANNTLTALAYQNLGGQVQDTSTGIEARASYGQASAFASRVQVIATTDGQGTGPQTHFGASAGSISQYSLWDMGQNLPLAPEVAAAMELAFNFDLVGRLEVEETPQSMASTRYTGGLNYISGQDNFQGMLTVSYGYIFPFPDLGYTTAGDSLLWGSYSRSFSARHRGATAGVITFIVTNVSANVARAGSSLTLSSVSLLDGTMPAGGLGVRMDATGLIIPVSEVPEPGALALWAAGLCGGLWLSRRRRPAALQR